jgi:hypothetical protein
LKLFGAFFVFALFVGAGIHANDVASAQQRRAEEWSGDNVRFVAIGLTGSMLLHAALSDASQAECDSSVDGILIDRGVVAQLKAAGFERVSCAQRTGDLR